MEGSFRLLFEFFKNSNFWPFGGHFCVKICVFSWYIKSVACIGYVKRMTASMQAQPTPTNITYINTHEASYKIIYSFNFSKIPISGGGLAAFFRNRGQFTKSCFCCLLSIFVAICAIKWPFS